MNLRENQLDEELESKKVIIFGRDVTKIPCFRNSWMYGISGGIGMGILTFMFTSRVRLASHITVGAMCGIALVSFTACRYQHAKDEFLTSQVRGLMEDSRSALGEEREQIIRQAQTLLKRND